MRNRNTGMNKSMHHRNTRMRKQALVHHNLQALPLQVRGVHVQQSVTLPATLLRQRQTAMLPSVNGGVLLLTRRKTLSSPKNPQPQRKLPQRGHPNPMPRQQKREHPRPHSSRMNPLDQQDRSHKAKSATSKMQKSSFRSQAH